MIAVRVRLEERPPWEARFIDDTRQGFYTVSNENWDGETCGRWQFAEQANMAVVLLDQDGIDYEGLSMNDLENQLDAQVEIKKCARCQKDFMWAQLGDSEECAGCRS